MNYILFSTEKLKSPSTLRSYNATYNAHLKQFENEKSVIPAEKLPEILDYVKHSNRRLSTKNTIIVLLGRLMLFAGISPTDVTKLKQTFNNDADETTNEMKQKIEKYIERQFRNGDMKSFVINFLLFNYDLTENELKTLTISKEIPNSRATGIFMRPNYIAIQSKFYDGFSKYGMKKIRIFSKRFTEYLNGKIGETIMDDNDLLTDYTMNGMSRDEYEDAFVSDLTGSRLIDYNKYR
jgi:hypothetical protein